MIMLARIVRLVTAVVVGVIVLGILLRVLGADRGNDLVALVDDAARWLVSPFAGIFDLSREKVQIAVNWGLAALVYAIVGGLIATLLVRAAVAGSGAWGPRRTV
jgi:hypothetical protein